MGKVGYIFPGQGSQFVGMGIELFDKYPDIVSICDDILGFSIKNLCVDDKECKLNDTRYTQPAIYVVNALMYNNSIERYGKPHIVAGHSLGEFNALLAAGVFDFETGLKLVKIRGELMSQNIGGRMAAVVGLNANKIEEILEQYNLLKLGISNYNAPYQNVISGNLEMINFAKEIFEKAGASLYKILNVSGAFHTEYMSDAKDKFASYVSLYHFESPQIVVISNITAKPYVQSEIKKLIVEHMVNPVRWVDTILYMIDCGVTDIYEVGPRNVLTSLCKQVVKENKLENININNIYNIVGK